MEVPTSFRSAAAGAPVGDGGSDGVACVIDGRVGQRPGGRQRRGVDQHRRRRCGQRQSDGRALLRRGQTRSTARHRRSGHRPHPTAQPHRVDPVPAPRSRHRRYYFLFFIFYFISFF